MAQRTFLSPLRISAIADIILFVLVLHGAGLFSSCISVTAARNSNNSKRIDDGGIKVLPSLPSSAREILAYRNQALTLRCPIIITEDVRVLDTWWMKDGVKLDLHSTLNSGQQQTNSQHQQLQTSTQAHHINPPSSSLSTTVARIGLTNEGDLHFEKINHKLSSSGQRHRNYSDEGDYRCVKKTPLGVVLSAVISVVVAPVTEARPTQEIKAKLGEPTLIECQIASSFPSLSSNTHFTWIRGNNITITQELDVRYNILSSGTLAISNVKRGDAGEYRCMVNDKSSNHLQRISYTNLVIQPGNENVSSEPPKILSTPGFEATRTVLILEEDEDMVLDCVASGIPLPTVNWIVAVINNENEVPTVEVSHSRSRTFRNSINITRGLVHGPSANLSCIVENGIGLPIIKTIEVYRLPALQREPVSYQYPPAKTVRFECKVEPTIFSLVWYKDGQLLETGKGRVKVKGNELVVSNTIRNDSGFYQCECVADDRVYAIGTARLLVNNNKEAPDAPTHVECLQRHPTALTVSWRPPAKVEDIISFTVHYMPTRDEERQKVVPPRVTNITITSLLPHTDYSIYIRSYSAKSASAQSVPVVCQTTEDVPQNKPPQLSIERHGPSSQVRLTWKPLTNKEARGKIILYKLQWRSVDGEFSYVRNIDGDSEEFVITDLADDQSYELRIIPSTAVGWPTKKDTWPWTPIPDANSHNNITNPNSTKEEYFAPPSLHLTVLNSTSVLVNWSEPPRPKEINVKGFRLTYSTKSDRVNDVVFYGPITLYNDAAREYLFTGLAPGSTYEFYLQTWGEDLENSVLWDSIVSSKFIGTFSDSDEGQTECTILPVITGFQVHPVSSNVVRLRWDQPPINSTECYFYTVKYNKVDSNAVTRIHSTMESVEINELQPYTSYEFVVQLSVKDGCVGPYSQKIESRTLPGLPGVPISLHWRVHNQSVVEIEWDPPLIPNGIIIKYYVEFQLNNSNPAPGMHQNASTSENNRGASVGTSTSSSTSNWIVKPTSNNSIFLNELQRNVLYSVRVKAETKAGVGNSSEIISVRIFNRKQEPLPPRDQPKQDPQHHDDSTTLGIIVGVAFSAIFITLCLTIIVCRNRFFPLISSRPPPGALYVNGNGHPPRAKRSFESLNCVEMKVLVGLTENNLDTKTGHPIPNGSAPSVTDPLLVHVNRGAPGRSDANDEDIIPNCVH